MLKKTTVVFIGIIMLLLLCSCDSEEVKQAKEAYADGNYDQVVELLSGQEDLSQEAQDMLTVSEANTAYENKEYMEAVTKLASTSTGVESEQFEEMFNAALDDAIANKEPDNIIELLALDESKSDVVYDKITATCSEKDYNGFIALEGLIKKLDDGDLKTKLSDFKKESKILKAESFLVGKWGWKTSDNEKPTKVKVMTYENNLVGRVTKVGTYLSDYHFQKDDVYWKDFKFENGKKFICYNLTRYEDGTVAGETASGSIDFKKDTIKLNVTGTTIPNREWKRIK